MTDAPKWIPDAPPAEPVEARPAATLVPLRDGPSGLEVLMARRNADLAFHGGAWVFPGGRIDAGDAAAAAGDPDHDGLAVARRAAVRETHEEAGLVVDAATLVHVSTWTTPEIMPKRFRTWFFVGAAHVGDAIADGGEMSDVCWFTPAEALERRAAGDIELAPPQFVTLLGLRDAADVAGALATARATPAPEYLPRILRIDGGAVALYQDDAAYAASDVDAPGPRHRLTMRRDGWVYERTV